MNFEDLNFSAELKDAIKKMNYEKATDVQKEAIPLMLDGHNVIVKSHTGSGKTAAFGIPISENILAGKSRGALVLCPTRELAVQVKEELKKINSKSGLKVSVFYGGHGMNAELREIERGIDILCATPGRLLDHFRNNALDPAQFDTAVLDEADRMLDMGFIQDLRAILAQVNPRTTHLFSATLDGSVANLIEEYIPTYEEVLLQEEIVGKNIMERHIKVPRDRKVTELVKIIEEAGDNRVLVFVSTKRSADFLSRKLFRMGYSSECIHGDKSQKARETGLENFKSGKRKILVATDVAARGLQIDNVEYVVNYDLATDADTHKHRIGRTGRMGEKGHAISFVGEDGRVIAVPSQSYGRRYRSAPIGGAQEQQQDTQGGYAPNPNYSPGGGFGGGRGFSQNRGRGGGTGSRGGFSGDRGGRSFGRGPSRGGNRGGGRGFSGSNRSRGFGRGNSGSRRGPGRNSGGNRNSR